MTEAGPTPPTKADGTVSVVNLASHTLTKSLTVHGHPRTVVSTQNSLFGKVYVSSPDSPYLTISQDGRGHHRYHRAGAGNIVDVRTTTQRILHKGNAVVVSRTPGFGQPCNLPPNVQAPAPGYLLSNASIEVWMSSPEGRPSGSALFYFHAKRVR